MVLLWTVLFALDSLGFFSGLGYLGCFSELCCFGFLKGLVGGVSGDSVILGVFLWSRRYSLFQ